MALLRQVCSHFPLSESLLRRDRHHLERLAEVSSLIIPLESHAPPHAAFKVPKLWQGWRGKRAQHRDGLSNPWLPGDRGPSALSSLSYLFCKMGSWFHYNGTVMGVKWTRNRMFTADEVLIEGPSPACPLVQCYRLGLSKRFHQPIREMKRKIMSPGWVAQLVGALSHASKVLWVQFPRRTHT